MFSRFGSLECREVLVERTVELMSIFSFCSGRFSFGEIVL